MIPVPEEVAAYAAGMNAVCPNWHIIAATISAIHLGTYDTTALEMAAREWTERNCRHPVDGSSLAEAIEIAVDKTRPTGAS